MKHNEIETLSELHRQAFGVEEGPEIAQLVKDLLAHPDTLSISVEREGRIVSNVLFTPFTFADHPQTKCQLLSPCGVLPEYQGQGVGKEMMERSIQHLGAIGTDAVFVLGVPTFYPRYGFAPTDKQTPYPEVLTVPAAWMALELSAGSLDPLSGPSKAIPQFMQAHLWDTRGHD